MKRIVNAVLDGFAAFLPHKGGATAIEYTLIASLISIGIIVSAGNLGSSVRAMFMDTAAQVSDAIK